MTTGSKQFEPARAFSNALALLRSLDSEFPAQRAHVLMQIALQPGMTVAQIGDAVDLSQSAVSRTLLKLQKFERLGVPGLDLIEQVVDPRESRRRLVFLSQNGKTFMTKLLRTLEPDFSFDHDTDARVQVDQLYEEAVSGKVKPRGRAKL